MSTTPSRAHSYFYPRSPCGERRPVNAFHDDLLTFLSTLSLRRATLGGQAGVLKSLISIHALLAESDAITDLTLLPFYISIHALLAESDFSLLAGLLVAL